MRARQCDAESEHARSEVVMKMDKELLVISRVQRELSSLDPQARVSCLNYILSREFAEQNQHRFGAASVGQLNRQADESRVMLPLGQ